MDGFIKENPIIEWDDLGGKPLFFSKHPFVFRCVFLVQLKTSSSFAIRKCPLKVVFLGGGTVLAHVLGFDPESRLMAGSNSIWKSTMSALLICIIVIRSAHLGFLGERIILHLSPTIKKCQGTSGGGWNSSAKNTKTNGFSGFPPSKATIFCQTKLSVFSEGFPSLRIADFQVVGDMKKTLLHVTILVLVHRDPPK